MRCPHLPDGFDFTDPDLLQARVPHPEFALMRETAPVWWCTQPPHISGFGDEGYWAVTRHADVKYVSTHPELFSSNTNTSVIRFNETISRDQIDVQKLIMLNIDWSNKMAAYDDPEYAITEEVGAEAAMEIVAYSMNLAAARKECPAEEIVRWATPVVSFQRTATQDLELGGQRIRKGERVGLFYSSANNDPEVFDSPDVFDITRDPNPHLGFGGGGPHFCLGKSLAVMEIDLIFHAIADVLPDLRLLEDPRRLRSAWLNGIKQLQVTTAPPPAA
ncbi:cytochrome P450 [Streptomyces sp. NPDC096095]|uniref:cytochrome P450 n=1 Tax=Streptomyces sp. NPDC096095 TaxID=3155545 RepID=UPI00332850B8